MKLLAEKINRLKAVKKLKNIELASLAGIANSTLADILKGKTERVSAGNLKVLADALGCTVDFLLDDGASEPAPPDRTARGVALSRDEAELLQLYRQLDQRGRDCVAALAKQQSGYREYSGQPAFAGLADEDWKQYVGSVSAARGGVKLVDEREAKEIALIKRAFLEE